MGSAMMRGKLTSLSMIGAGFQQQREVVTASDRPYQPTSPSTYQPINLSAHHPKLSSYHPTSLSAHGHHQLIPEHTITLRSITLSPYHPMTYDPLILSSADQHHWTHGPTAL